MKYDSSKETKTADVSREASEAGKETKEAISAVKDLVTGHGSLDAVAKEAREAAAALAETGEAALDLVVDSAKRFFRTVYGFRLHDPSQGKAIEEQATEADHTAWMKDQIEAGLVVEVDSEGNRVSAAVAPPSKAPEDVTSTGGDNEVPK